MLDRNLSCTKSYAHSYQTPELGAVRAKQCAEPGLAHGRLTTCLSCARRPAVRVAGLLAEEAVPAGQGQDQVLPAR